MGHLWDLFMWPQCNGVTCGPYLWYHRAKNSESVKQQLWKIMWIPRDYRPRILNSMKSGNILPACFVLHYIFFCWLRTTFEVTRRPWKKCFITVCLLRFGRKHWNWGLTLARNAESNCTWCNAWWWEITACIAHAETPVQYLSCNLGVDWGCLPQFEALG